MDERFLDFYNAELRHLRKTAGEFAREYPKIAGRLALDPEGQEMCPDPYVERLLEGFAWLAARVHLKLDAEFPRFTQALLETVYPDYLSPIPSMAMVRFEPSPNEAALGAGITLDRGTMLRSLPGKDATTPCTFRTAHSVRLVAARIRELRYFTRDRAELNLPGTVSARAALRIRLQATAGLTFAQVRLDPVTFYIRGADELPGLIYEQLFAKKSALVVQSATERGKTLGVFPPSAIRQVGFGNESALLPISPRSFEGYRLLREYFAFPQRFHFFELVGFAEALDSCQDDQIDLVIALKEEEADLEGRVDSACLDLHCTPAINLFSRSLDRISLSERFSEFHIVADRNHPYDYEIYELEKVTGYGATAADEQEFRPFYLARDTDQVGGAYYTAHRVPPVPSQRERQHGRRSEYRGSELFLSLVDANAAPYRSALREIGLRALCTNRHLPYQMPVNAGASDFTLDVSAPVVAVRCISGPTLPQPSFAEGRYAWRLISHLSLNYLSLVDARGEEGAAALREMLRLYADAKDRQIARQIEGLRNVRSAPVLRRVATPGPITFARGLQIEVTLDEAAFEGSGVFLFGAVLEQFFSKYVSLNSFAETVVRTLKRGEIMRWPAHVGRSQVL